MKSALISLVLGAVLAYAGYYLLESSSGLVSQESYDKTERLCLNAESSMGILQDSVMEITIASSTSYELFYDYQVNGKSYRAKKQVHDMDLAVPATKIWYEKDLPSSNMVDDPCETFEHFKKTKRVGNEMYYFIPGALLGLIGLSLAWGGIKGFFGSLIRGKKEDQV